MTYGVSVLKLKLSQMLLVCHRYHNDADTIRIISARKADEHEKRQYEGFKL